MSLIILTSCSLIQTKPTNRYNIPKEPVKPTINWVTPENPMVEANYSCISPSGGRELMIHLKEWNDVYKKMSGSLNIINGDTPE